MTQQKAIKLPRRKPGERRLLAAGDYEIYMKRSPAVLTLESDELWEELEDGQPTSGRPKTSARECLRRIIAWLVSSEPTPDSTAWKWWAEQLVSGQWHKTWIRWLHVVEKVDEQRDLKGELLFKTLVSMGWNPSFPKRWKVSPKSHPGGKEARETRARAQQAFRSSWFLMLAFAATENRWGKMRRFGTSLGFDEMDEQAFETFAQFAKIMREGGWVPRSGSPLRRYEKVLERMRALQNELEVLKRFLPDGEA